jgi:hypothetical protein
MTGAIRNWWWLVGGALAMAVAVVLIATVGVVGSCADLYYGTSVPSVSPCQESLDAAQRNGILGSALLLGGLTTVAYGFGYRRGRRAERSDEPVAQAAS